MSAAAARSVLLTAASTPLGRAIAHELVAHVSVRNVVAVLAPGEATPRVPVQGVHFVSADLTRRRDVHDLIFGAARAHGVDTVVHTPLHRDPRDEGKRVFDLDVLSTRHLLALSEQQTSIACFILRGSSDVYRIASDEPTLIDEDHPLALAAEMTQPIRNRAEADLTVCARIGSSRLRIAVLRCAEVLAAGTGSQLYDYLGSRVCLRPLGFDPIVNVLSIEDTARAVVLAVLHQPSGPFNVPGKDTLPLSELIHRAGRVGVPVPGLALRPLYALRARTTDARFRYAADRQRFHYGGILDGSRACEVLGYVPEVPIAFARLFSS